jgi:hypothetical protein
MKIFNLYEHIVEEEVVTQKAESCISNFGHELFGDELGGKEKNTRIENNMVDLLKDFTDNQYGEETNSKLKSGLKVLKSCMSTYPEVLMPDNSVAYRGESIPFKYLFQNYKDINDNGSFTYLYKAKSLVQSWTESYKVGSNYVLNQINAKLEKILNTITNPDYDTLSDVEKIKWLSREIDYTNFLTYNIGVLLSHMAAPDSFLFKGKYFNKLSTFDDEFEILRVSKEPIRCVGSINPALAKLTSELNKFKKQLDITSDDFNQ